ncbi:MAG: N-acetylglucosamine-6-phosphate deacetylase [Chloroflexi bacterium]|nr:N-acetylglucosamine-6-phosphate deacetylase [Chloroflexota bacterium]
MQASHDALLISGGIIHTRHERIEPGWILVRDGVIADVGEGKPPPIGEGVRHVDVRGLIVAPGFVDLHVHGGGGADVMDATGAAFRTVARAHAAGGTTAWVGTTVAAPHHELLRVLDAAEGVVGRPLDGATLLGIHLEGPYLSTEQRGAHRWEYVRPPEPDEYEALFARLDRLRGRSRVTAAPELPGAIEMGIDLDEHGLHGAIGHSNADLDTVGRALMFGYSHVTHLYSCTSGLRIQGGYKTPGIQEAALLFDDLSVELIGDGHHVPSSLIRLVTKVKPVERVCLVTDAMRAAGLGPGTYRVGDVEAIVEDGVAKLPDRSKFAGSVCTMAQAVRTAVFGAGVRLSDALQMASLTPASLLGVSDRKGEIARGKDADMVLLDLELEVQMTVVGGRVVFTTETRRHGEGLGQSA